MSYKYDIILWLKRCLELSASQPLIRETIVQYINTIKNLTNSNMNKNDEILQILCKPDIIDVVFEIFNSRDAFINFVINNHFIPRLKILAESKGFELRIGTTDWIGTPLAAGSLYNKDWKYFKLSFEFEKRGLGDLIFGFRRRRNYKREDIAVWEELQNRFQCRDKNNHLWIWKNFEGNTYWNNKNVIKDLIDDNSIILSNFCTMIDFALECAEGLEL